MVVVRVRSLVELAPELHRIVSGGEGAFIELRREGDHFLAEVTERRNPFEIMIDLRIPGAVCLLLECPCSIHLPPTGASLEVLERLLWEVERTWWLIVNTECSTLQLAEQALRLRDSVKRAYPVSFWDVAVEDSIYGRCVRVHGGDSQLEGRPFNEAGAKLIEQLATKIERAWRRGRALGLIVHPSLSKGFDEAEIIAYNDRRAKYALVDVNLHNDPYGLDVCLPPPIGLSGERASRALRELLGWALAALQLAEREDVEMVARFLAMTYYARRVEEILALLYPGWRINIRMHDDLLEVYARSADEGA